MKRLLAILLAALLLAAAGLAEEEGGTATPATEGPLQAQAAETPVEDSDQSTEGFTPEDDPSRRIIGHDDRTYVNESAYPYRAIAYMQVHARCGCDWECTGFMVGPSGLMTSSAALVCDTHHQTADRMTMYFGYYSPSNYYYKYTGATTYWYGTDFSGGYDYTWDYGYVKLQENVGDIVGWFGLSSCYDSELDGGVYTLAGYRNGDLMTDYDLIYVENDYIVRHYIDTAPGYGGSPIFTYDDHVVAVNVAESNLYEVNYGRRITNSLISEMRSHGLFD